MGKYSSYPKYKTLDVEWLDCIPEHWSNVSLKMMIDVRDGTHDTPAYVEPSDESYPLVTSKDVTGGYIDLSDCKQISRMDYELIVKRSGVAKGDILMPMIGTVGSPILLEQEVEIAIKNLALFRTSVGDNKLCRKYLFYFLNSSECSVQFSLESRGGVQNFVSLGTLRNLGLPLVPRNEQTQIANFLDHETAKIDTLIEKQQQLIKLLKEKRQAVISHAVTKGLNPQAPMKDSGVEWCDYIPEHWIIGKLGYFARVGNGATPSRENQSFWNGGTVGWLNSSKVNDVIITEAEQFITPLALAQTSVQPVKANDLVIAITGEGQTRGRVAICQLEATINQHLASIRIYDDCLHHEFLFLWLSANYERIRFESTGAGSTKGAITCGDIKSYPIVIAPLSEQTEIINHIKLQNQHFSNLIAKADNQVQLLKERRTALISAAVTGKIDVRNWQAPSTSITKIPEGEV
ncbi:restriction endonuclease subunit S [Vibrio parahaemolyticus]|nr:restriction endonuclease subunit S [Vibrio parahaemolyticus]EJG0888623.1 restriction endonuclease subunit S [Vibrio parahaemolyticus]MDF4744933.1 restriction endonuclease subunit S [Vibrio parahaemolyticus]